MTFSDLTCTRVVDPEEVTGVDDGGCLSPFTSVTRETRSDRSPFVSLHIHVPFLSPLVSHVWTEGRSGVTMDEWRDDVPSYYASIVIVSPKDRN